MKKILFIILVVLLTSCNDKKNNCIWEIYQGGKIVNYECDSCSIANYSIYGTYHKNTSKKNHKGLYCGK